MTKQLEKFVISFQSPSKKKTVSNFYTLAEKHIVRNKKTVSKRLSTDIDAILYAK